MALRIDKDLLFHIECEMREVFLIHDPEANEKKLLRATLQVFAEKGFAKRYVDKKGRVAWKQTDQLLQHLEDAELTEYFDD